MYDFKIMDKCRDDLSLLFTYNSRTQTLRPKHNILGRHSFNRQLEQSARLKLSVGNVCEPRPQRSRLLRTLNGRIVEVGDYKKFKHMIADSCKRQISQLYSTTRPSDEMDVDVSSSESIGTNVCAVLNSTNLAQARARQQNQLQQQQAQQRLIERQKRRAAKEWRGVASRLMLSKVDKCYR